jgi:hypothetical protein
VLGGADAEPVEDAVVQALSVAASAAVSRQKRFRFEASMVMTEIQQARGQKARI